MPFPNNAMDCYDTGFLNYEFSRKLSDLLERFALVPIFSAVGLLLWTRIFRRLRTCLKSGGRRHFQAVRCTKIETEG
jgi:hypothetical protein